MKDYKMKYYILFIFPVLALFITYTIIPMFVGLYYSFTNFDGFMRMDFVGLQNYRTLLTDVQFYKVLLQTILYVFGVVFTSYVFSLGLALILMKKDLPGKSIFRTFFYLPSILSFVVVGVMWRWLLSDSFSILNQMRETFGLLPIKTLSDSSFAFVSIILVTAWCRIGFYMVIFLGGLYSISSTLKEASSIDGANEWQHFWMVTMPQLKPISLVVIILSTIEAFKAFPLITNLTGGGPNRSTVLIVQYIYETGFSTNKVGYASAMSFVLLVIIAIITALNFKMTGDGDQ